jgi:hypothetical protein
MRSSDPSEPGERPADDVEAADAPVLDTWIAATRVALGWFPVGQWTMFESAHSPTCGV